MVLLLFDEVAVTLVDSNYGIPFSLPKAIVRRYVIRSIIIVICQV